MFKLFFLRNQNPFITDTEFFLLDSKRRGYLATASAEFAIKSLTDTGIPKCPFS